MPKSDFKAFASTQNKGFHMTFKNGITASVQFGTLNYCGARSWDFAVNAYDAPMKTEDGCWDSETAEVAAWDKEGTWITKSILPDINDEVKGWLTTDDVLDFLNRCAKL